MIKNYESKRKALVLYTTAVCNLKCSYCYIDKNPALIKIDQLLDDSFKEKDYYFNFTKELFKDPNQLVEVQFWGGEPTLRLDRAYDTVNSLIGYYPKLEKFMLSTNFTGENWFEQIKGFLDILGRFSNRKFRLNLQLSIDGPKNINDFGRGSGTTEKFLNHLKVFLNKVDEEGWIPQNVEINAFFKPTLSKETLPFLQTKEEILNYYKFFDTVSTIIMRKTNSNFNFNLSIPNLAEPSPYTQADGIMFANFCKICYELGRENKKDKIFNFYEHLVPFTKSECRLSLPAEGKERLSCIDMKDGCPACGIGWYLIGLLPEHKISLCHSGFCDLLSEYKLYCQENPEQIKEPGLDSLFFNNQVTKKILCEVEDLPLWAEISSSFQARNSEFQMANTIVEIQQMANLGIILPKYKKIEEATKAARYMRYIIPFCFRNNLQVTGSLVTQPMGTIKMLLNGALDYIEKEYNDEDMD